MNLEDKIEEIKIYGSLGYSADQVADALEFPFRSRALLADRLSNPDDVLAMAYRKGYIISEQKTDMSLAKQAQTGDIDAIEMQAARSKERKLKALKKNLFGI